MKRLLTALLLTQLGCAHLPVPSYYDASATRSGEGRAILPDGSLYDGGYRNGLFHGEGTLTNPNGTTYVGAFRSGLLHGPGRYTSHDGVVYTGAFLKGAFHGEGVITFSNGDQYQGEFSTGLMHGEGRYLASDGTRYDGRFENDVLAGRGTIVYPNDDRYEGEWRDWIPHGDGVWTESDGATYVGQFNDGEPAGGFLITYPSGARYEGQMDGWSYAGTGHYTDDSGTSYSGAFEDDAFTGNGVITSKDGRSYTGEVEDWRPHGTGTLTRRNGDAYAGVFKRGRYAGQGTLKRGDGAVYEGAFEYGKFDGQGTLRWTSEHGPHVLTGPWRKGLYVGPDRQAYLAEGIAAADAEQLLFDQKPILDRALSQVERHRAQTTDLFLMTFASHGKQNVFRAEAETARSELGKRFDLTGRALSLVNHPATTETEPLATATNLRYALGAVSQKMDLSEDVLFLFLTSHGAKDHALSVNLPGASMDQLSADALDQMLDEAGIVWRIIVVSACYSGGFIKPLQNDQSLIMTSARADRTSFGCSDDAEMTYFGRAFFEQALPLAPDLISAFFTARKRVTEREQEKSFEPSEPQIHIGAQMESKLARSALMRAPLPTEVP